MISVDIANAIFVICLVAGGVLLWIALLFDDELDGLRRALRLTARRGELPVVPYLLAFLVGFGVGGLFGTRVLGAEPAPAAAVGLVAGLIAIGLVLALVGAQERRRENRRSMTNLDDFVGHRGRVTSFIKSGGLGTIAVRGTQPAREFVATSDVDLDEGALVVIRDVDEAQSTLVVTLASHAED